MVNCRPRASNTIMVVIRWKVFSIPGSLWSGIKRQWRRLQITRNSLFYNHFTDQTYIIDVLMEPMFWFVDNFTKTLGPFFVFAVCALTTSVVFIAYWVGLLFWWNKNPYFTVILVLVGKWLLMNVCFHYYMAAYTLPGYPPEGILIPEAASICKKCIAPKPPRTHHCSVCDKCILKMDHHCPWLNNCIGHYNHRYFFLYMVYTCLGVLYLMIFGCEIAYNEVWIEPEEELVGHPVRFNNSVMITMTELMFENASEEPESHTNHTLQRRCLIYMAFICSGVFVALGSLAMWHAKLIGRGETSIEANINIAETKRLAAIKKKYVNPYNFGPRKNWRLFLGLVDGRTWWHVAFPSAHKPVGIGLTWQTIHSEQEEELFSVDGGKSQEDSFKTFPPVFEKMKLKPKTIAND